MFQTRLRHEARMPLFHLTEPAESESSIDVHRTFAPKPTLRTALLKIVSLALALSTALMVATSTDSPVFELAYLTIWSLLFALLYQITSIGVMLRLSRMEGCEKKERLHWSTKIAWATYALASTLEATVALSYWPLRLAGVVTDPITYTNFMTHGGIALIVLIDGSLLCKIPLRLKQVLLPMSVGCAYTMWTIIHWKLNLGNPHTEDFDTIYEILDWQKSFRLSLLQSFLLTFFCHSSHVSGFVGIDLSLVEADDDVWNADINELEEDFSTDHGQYCRRCAKEVAEGSNSEQNRPLILIPPSLHPLRPSTPGSPTFLALQLNAAQRRATTRQEGDINKLPRYQLRKFLKQFDIRRIQISNIALTGCHSRHVRRHGAMKKRPSDMTGFEN
ncbi:hypothetical protein THAOC_02575 [Thalassiosira oceanica]|uniref:Uncharacterized protein n=1 Tax=Thalassiosira oceanica TaxID=159749 RepID=K0TEA8_THAOC|nr:hypothetical protein THAOC_02575 [Thalassiosira oceanica]|eukprot:EJK75695.1 hypothetical protein THAOC_02575 [Thalassiosira oceanica]